MTRITRAALLKRLGLAAVGVGLLALLPTASFAGPIDGVKQAQAPSSLRKWTTGAGGAMANVSARGLTIPAVYGYYYEPYDEYRPAYRSRRPNSPEAYWPGTERWWKSMDAWGRTGNH